MTRRLGISITVMAALAGVLTRGQTTPPLAPQTFRTTTDVVIVDVSVKRGGVPVTGLTAKDFQLRDDNVTQRIESVEPAAPAVDLTLVLDVSGFPHSRVARAANPAPAIEWLNAEVAKAAAILRPVDRVRVIASDTYVQEVVPLSPAQTIPPVGQLTTGGASSSFDAILAALLQPVDPDRRHIVIASVKVFDTMSAVEASTVADVAAHSNALLHVVLRQTDSGQEAAQENFQCERAAVCSPVARSWTPYFRVLIPPLEFTAQDGTATVPQLKPDGLALQEGAVATGGALHQAELMRAPTLAATIATAFDDFRTGYVLRYKPQGVKREGWHDLTVAVPGARGATVHSRNGYGIDWTPVSPTAVTPVSASTKAAAVSAAPRTPEEFAAAYDRGDRDAMRLGLQRTADPVRLLQDIAAAGNPWPGSARREAGYALELADSALSISGMSGVVVSAEAGRLLARFSRLVRNPIEPDAFERAWLWAAICLAEGRFAKMTAAPLVDYALERFPNEPRFVLARAIVADQRWQASGSVAAGGASSGPDQVTDAYAAEVIARFQTASAFPATHAEANIRLAWFLHRIGRHADAIAAIDAAPATQDSAVSYLGHLFLGHALVATGRLDAAIAAFRSAVADVPGAQSARVALMSALAARGENAAAEDMGQAIETAPSAGDPWFNYWLGDARWSAEARTAVRAFSTAGASVAGKAGGQLQR